MLISKEFPKYFQKISKTFHEKFPPRIWKYPIPYIALRGRKPFWACFAYVLLTSANSSIWPSPPSTHLRDAGTGQTGQTAVWPGFLNSQSRGYLVIICKDLTINYRSGLAKISSGVPAVLLHFESIRNKNMLSMKTQVHENKNDLLDRIWTQCLFAC